MQTNVSTADSTDLQTQLTNASAHIVALQLQVQQLTQQLDWFKRQIFGVKSERVMPDPAIQPDMLAALGVVPPAVIPEQPAITVTYERRKKLRAPNCVTDQGLRFDDSVPVEVIELPAPAKGEVIDTKITYRLAQRPGAYVVLEFRRPVVKQAHDARLVTTAAPAAVIEQSFADVSFLAGMLIDKFLYHLPLYRQHQRLLDAGITLARPTLTNLSRSAIDLLVPIYQAQFGHITTSRVLAMDETPIKAGRKGEGKLRTAYFWPIYGEHNEVCFHYADSRAHAVVRQALGRDFSGVLLSDGYAAYARYAEKTEHCQLANCWAHARRRFEQALTGHPETAKEALAFIRVLYAHEEEIRKRGLTDENKLHYRTTHSEPVVRAFWGWCYEQRQRTDLLPKDRLAAALTYAWERQAPLQVFLTDPDVPIDTNHLERAIRPIPMGRKNYLFCWTELGAKHVGVIQSLLQTCKLHDVDPHTYLVDVLQRVSVHPASRVLELTPREWKQRFAANPMHSDVER